MHRASRVEVCFYLLVVVLLFIEGYKQSWQFFNKTIPVIVQSTYNGQLPVRLSSILDIQGDYIRQHPELQPYLHSSTHASTVGPLAALARVPVLGKVASLVQLVQQLPRDTSDVQWREFRAGLLLLSAGMFAYVSISQLAHQLGFLPWLITCTITSVGFLGVLHGAQAVWPCLFAIAFYQLSRTIAGKSYGPVVMWAAHITCLVLIRYNDGIKFSSISQSLSPLDHHTGMLRWYIHYNFTLLRMISHFMDTHWALRSSSARASKGGAAVKLPVQGVQGFLLYILYCFYPPLYIAGPVMTYTNFVHQAKAPTTVTNRQKYTYALRWIAAVCLLELMTRTLYANAVAKHGLITSGLLRAYGINPHPLEYAYVGFWVLVFMWLKFLVIWRYFRSITLFDGLDPPENMRRCICNNYDVQGFWQGWHSSFNRWLVRYLYVPLGGSAWMWANVWVCFLFVALWHDLEFRLLAWGLIMPAAFIPELAIKALGRSKLMARYHHRWMYRAVAALMGTCNILALMAANLVGFVVGLEGLRPLFDHALGQPRTALIVIGALFCGVQLMFAIRGWEADRKARQQQGLAKQERGQTSGLEVHPMAAYTASKTISVRRTANQRL